MPEDTKAPAREQDQVALTHSHVTNPHSTLFGKVYKTLKEDAEYVLVEIETEFGKFEHLFHRSEVNPVPDPAATAGTPAGAGVEGGTASVSAPATTVATPTSIPAAQSGS